MSINTVNVISKAQLVTNWTLDDFFKFADKKFQHRPTMALFKRNGQSILLFTSLKCRCMGFPSNASKTNDTLEEIIKKQHETLADFAREFVCLLSNLTFVTSTMTYKLPFQVNYYKNIHCLQFDLEIFCASKFINNHSSIHINIFHNGIVIATGIKSQNQMIEIIRKINKEIVNYLFY